MIHGGTDDLGLVGDKGSLSSGNAGARVACGIIEVHNSLNQPRNRLQRLISRGNGFQPILFPHF